MTTKQRKHILFDEASHTYTNVETKELYQSATSFVSRFHEKFDANAIALNLVTNIPKYQLKYQDIEQELAIADIKREWKRRTDIGNTVHKILEHHFLGINVLDPTKEDVWNRRILMLTEAYDHLNLKEKHKGYEFFSEMILFSDHHKLAGQSDKVLINHELHSFKVLDYKTNQKGIEKTSYRDRRMFAPVSHLPDCNYYHYALQLSLYAYFLEQELGYSCAGLELLWVNTNSQDFIVIDSIPVPNLIEEIDLLLDHHQLLISREIA